MLEACRQGLHHIPATWTRLAHISRPAAAGAAAAAANTHCNSPCPPPALQEELEAERAARADAVRRLERAEHRFVQLQTAFDVQARLPLPILTYLCKGVLLTSAGHCWYFIGMTMIWLFIYTWPTLCFSSARFFISIPPSFILLVETTARIGIPSRSSSRGMRSDNEISASTWHAL